MQDDEMNLMTIDTQTAVEHYYGGSELVDSFAERLTPLYRGVDSQTVKLVAQLAIAQGANPLPSAGEIWVWSQWDAQSHGYKLTVALGAQYYRRTVTDNNDTVVWVQPPDLMSDARAMKHGASDKDILAECAGYLKSEYRKLRAEGFSMVEAEKRLTRRGVGRVAYGEMFAEQDLKRKDGKIYKKAGEPFDPPKGRTWLWVAEKRAEKDLLKKIAVAASPLTARIQAYNQRHLELLKRENMELPAGAGNGVELEQLNNQLFDAPIKEERHETAVIEGEVTEVAKTTEQTEYVGPFGKQGNVPEPTDWVAEMLRAKTLDQWAYRAYQSDWGKATLRDAYHAKTFALALLGDVTYTADRNEELTHELEAQYKFSVAVEKSTPVSEPEEQKQEPDQTQTGEIERPFADGVIPTNWRQKALKSPNLSQFVAAVEQMGLGYHHQNHIRNTLKGLGLTWKDNDPKTLLEALETYKGDDEG